MTEWGFRNAHLEPWNFGHPGWLNESAAGHIVAPVHANLKFEVLGWTPSTNGPVTASADANWPPRRGPLRARHGGWTRRPRQHPDPSRPDQGRTDAMARRQQGESPRQNRDAGEGRGDPGRLRPTREAPSRRVRSASSSTQRIRTPAAASDAVPRPSAIPVVLTANQVAEMTDAWLKANGASAAHQRRRHAARPDPRLPEPHLRSRQSPARPSSCAMKITAGSSACSPTAKTSAFSSTS